MATTGTFRKPKTWAKANLNREDFPNRHEYRKAASIGFKTYQDNKAAEKTLSAKPMPKVKSVKTQTQPKEVQKSLDKMTKAELLAYIASMQAQTQPEPEPRPKPKTKAEPKPKAESKAKSKAKTETRQDSEEILYGEYSEKSMVVFGGTKAIKDDLKALGGVFNARLNINGQIQPGWIFTKKNWDKVAKLF